MPAPADLETLRQLLRESLDSKDTRSAALSICQAAGTTNLETVASKLGEITELILYNREFHSLGALRLLPNLKRLAAKNASVRDIHGIEACERLGDINLSGNPIEDISPIGKLAALKILDISGANISEINPLAGCTSLKSLRLCSTSINSFEPLFGLPLHELGLWDSGFHSFDQCPVLPKLKDFWAPECQVVSLAGIERFPNLVSLDLGDCELRTIDGVEHLTKLRKIALAGNWNLTSLKPLFSLPIESITIERDRLDAESIEFLKSKGL